VEGPYTWNEPLLKYGWKIDRYKGRKWFDIKQCSVSTWVKQEKGGKHSGVSLTDGGGVGKYVQVK